MHIIVKHNSNCPTQVIAGAAPVVHPTYEHAKTEATRLAKLDPNAVFHIMFCCADVQQEPVPIKVTQHFSDEASCYR